MTVLSSPTDAETSGIPTWLRELRVIDVDAHITEAADLWTRHAPQAFKDRVPHIASVDGKEQWVVDDVVLSEVHQNSVILRDGSKASHLMKKLVTHEQAHSAAWDMRARVELLDRLGIWAQVLYPNLAGFGSQNFFKVKDPKVRELCATVYNDAMAEIQEVSDGRLLPMALLPWWDVDASVAEIRRIAKLGLRGALMCSDPQDVGLPDLAQPVWQPLWQEISGLGLPLSFHIGASISTKENFSPTNMAWPSLNDSPRFMIASMMLFLANARVIANLILGGVLERNPDLKIVSAESGIGWVPYFLETMDYNYADAPTPFLKAKPSDYFHRQVFSTFWYETSAPMKLLDEIGVRRIMFETDIPHPVCLYPDIQEHIIKIFGNADPEVRRRLLQDNAAELYHIDLKNVSQQHPNAQLPH